MGRRGPSCSVCKHPHADIIDERLALGQDTPLSASVGFGIPASTLYGHLKRCHPARVAELLADAAEHLTVSPAPPVYLVNSLAYNEARVRYAMTDPKLRPSALALLSHAHRQAAEALHRITTGADSSAAADAAERAELCGRVLAALSPFPEAMQAVADELAEAAPAAPSSYPRALTAGPERW